MYAVLRQGRIAEAVAIAQEWVARTKAEQLGPDVAALWQRRLASSLLLRRDFEQALAATRAGFGEQQRLGAEDTSHNATIGRSAEIHALISLRRWPEADAVYTEYLNSTRGDKVAFQRASNTSLEAVLAAKNGRADAGLKRISATLRNRTRLYGNDHYLTMESREIRGVVQLISGSIAAALLDYEALFSDATAPLKAGSPELSQLLVKEQEVRRAVQGIYRQISELLAENIEKGSEEQRARVLGRIKELRASANKTQLQLDTVRQDISGRFPAYQDLVMPVNPKPEALQKSLGNGEAFLSILPTHLGTYIWVINSGGQQALHVSRWTTTEIDSRVAALRKNLDLSQTLSARPDRFEFGAFHEMYRELIAPVMPALKGAPYKLMRSGQAFSLAVRELVDDRAITAD